MNLQITPTTTPRDVAFYVDNGVALQAIGNTTITFAASPQVITQPNLPASEPINRASSTADSLINNAASLMLNQIATDPLQYQVFYKSSLSDLTNNGSYGDHIYMSSQTANPSRIAAVNTF